MCFRQEIMEDITQVEKPHKVCTAVASPKEVTATERFRARFYHDMSWIGQKKVPRWKKSKKSHISSLALERMFQI